MVRLLILLAVLALIALIAWSVVRALHARRRREAAEEEPFRVIESVGDGQARVQIGRPLSGEVVLIGAVALDDEDFDDRFARLILQAEDRVAMLNASRRLGSAS